MSTWICTRQNELTHHGIKGMKWGIRRFQNKDGSLTSAGRRRYDEPNIRRKEVVKKAENVNTTVSKGSKPKEPKKYKIPENKSLHRLKLEEKYMQNGMTREQAEQAAAKRIRTEKFVAAAAAVTVASCVAYAKYKNYTTDKIFETNTEFQRIMRLSPNDIIREDSRQYIAINKRDKIKYKGVYANHLSKLNETKASREKGLQVYNVTMKNKNEMRVASRKRAEDTFKQLYLNNEEFRKNLREDAKHIGIGRVPFNNIRSKLMNGDKLSNRDFKKAYDYFNADILMDRDIDGNNNKNSNIFFNALRKQGINAIQDVNDQKYSGYRAKLPIITFDNSFEYTKKVLDNKEIKENHKKALVDILSPELMTSGALLVGYYSLTPMMDKYEINKKVLKYKEAHPNTKMSDAEIRQMAKKELEEELKGGENSKWE